MPKDIGSSSDTLYESLSPVKVPPLLKSLKLDTKISPDTGPILNLH